MNQYQDVVEVAALRRLADEYSRGVDTRDGARFASVFSPGGVLAVYEPGNEGGEPSLTYTGTEELTTVVGLVDNWNTTMHLMANHVVEIDGDTAEGLVYGLTFHYKDGADPAAKGEDTLMVMHYRDQYVHADGRWWIARRDVLRQWTEYSAGERALLADSQAR
jgi:hypothetical protein